MVYIQVEGHCSLRTCVHQDRKASIYSMGDDFLSDSEVAERRKSVVIETYEELMENAVPGTIFPLYPKKSFFGKEYIATPVGNITKKNFKPITIQSYFEEQEVTVDEARRRLTPLNFRAYMQTAFEDDELIRDLQIEED
mgnify:CR=1 FL=1